MKRLSLVKIGCCGAGTAGFFVGVRGHKAVKSSSFHPDSATASAQYGIKGDPRYVGKSPAITPSEDG